MPKVYSREYLKENGHLIFKKRELIIEREEIGENVMLRFKIGDGVRPYSMIQYVSSLYALYPEICMCDKEYNTCLNIKFDNTGETN